MYTPRALAALTDPPAGFSSPNAVAGPVTIRQPVAWGELDRFGHVNHTIFLRWLENVRIAWFERVGLAASIADNRLGPILARVECDYRAPVNFPDVIWANVRCTKLGRSSLSLQSEVWSEQRRAIVAEGAVIVVVIDFSTQRSTPIPEAVRAAIQALDAPPERVVNP